MSVPGVGLLLLALQSVIVLSPFSSSSFSLLVLSVFHSYSLCLVLLSSLLPPPSEALSSTGTRGALQLLPLPSLSAFLPRCRKRSFLQCPSQSSLSVAVSGVPLDLRSRPSIVFNFFSLRAPLVVSVDTCREIFLTRGSVSRLPLFFFFSSSRVQLCGCADGVSRHANNRHVHW